MSTSKSEADEMLDAYVYDYLLKKQLHETARAFHDEVKVSTDSAPVVDAPDSFLFGWWSVFWDLALAQTGLSCSEEAVTYLKIQQIKALEMWKQEGLEKTQFLDQSPALQQQHRGGTPVVIGSAGCPISNDPLMRQNWATSNTMGRKCFRQQNALDDVTIKQKEANNVGQLLSMDCTSSLNAVAAITGGQDSGQTLLSAPSILQGIPQKVQDQNQLYPGSTQGLDQLGDGLLWQNNLTQSSQSFDQDSQWQEILLQAQEILVNPSYIDFENQRSLLLNNQNVGLGKDSQSNSVGDSIRNIVTPAQIGSPILPYPNSDIFLKQLVQKSNQHLQQYSKHSLSSHHSQSLSQLDGSTIVDGSISSILERYCQASKSQIERKRKLESSQCTILANTFGTVNTIGPSSGSPSTPSTQTSWPTLQQNVHSSKRILDTDDLSALTVASLGTTVKVAAL